MLFLNCLSPSGLSGLFVHRARLLDIVPYYKCVFKVRSSNRRVKNKEMVTWHSTPKDRSEVLQIRAASELNGRVKLNTTL